MQKREERIIRSIILCLSKTTMSFGKRRLAFLLKEKRGEEKAEIIMMEIKINTIETKIG